MARVGAEVRRQDFIEAAVKVIAEYGVANATTRRIAAAANSPLASLHYVFHTKDELFDAVYESLIDTPQQSLLHVTAGATAADSVAEILRQLVGWFTTHPQLATTQFELFFWNLRNNPAMASKIYTDSIEATKQAIEQVDEQATDSAQRFLVQHRASDLFDGLLLAWSAHGDQERLNAETEAACQAVKLLVASF
ncbi:TPA: TetR/AcrR family transcriptional regulator [Pseudomonas aeruginosa]|uniref:TetR family transcriptional regulator n=2 Tax=Pseudomonas aeruginosa TaxID=287 RepID=UPI0027D380BB|nr:TetR family transcriptional regulator [Pseudomonas aeruginosa]MDQ4168937.1 TetR/AcrR family transcriptional regulator [Pseudomonas aeruginosa]HCF1376798.1 TetR/AcrR family transcriptional regulator [Pseudomonas aeruginosa]HCF4239072.1 TetR/AcrR family transcriptional regulator [Pseudomonas aeruginosa]